MGEPPGIFGIGIGMIGLFARPGAIKRI